MPDEREGGGSSNVGDAPLGEDTSGINVGDAPVGEPTRTEQVVEQDEIDADEDAESADGSDSYGDPEKAAKTGIPGAGEDADTADDDSRGSMVAGMLAVIAGALLTFTGFGAIVGVPLVFVGVAIAFPRAALLIMLIGLFVTFMALAVLL